MRGHKALPRPSFCMDNARYSPRGFQGLSRPRCGGVTRAVFAVLRSENAPRQRRESLARGEAAPHHGVHHCASGKREGEWT